MGENFRSQPTRFAADDLPLSELSQSSNPSRWIDPVEPTHRNHTVDLPGYHDYEAGAPHDPNYQTSSLRSLLGPDKTRDPLDWPRSAIPRWTVQVSCLQLGAAYGFILMLIIAITAVLIFTPKQDTIIDVSPHFHIGGSGDATSIQLSSVDSSSAPTLAISVVGTTTSLPAATTASASSLAAPSTTSPTISSSPSFSAISSASTSTTSEVKTQGPSIVFQTITPSEGTVTSVVLITTTISASRPVVTRTTDVTASSAVEPKPPLRPVESKRIVKRLEISPRNLSPVG